MLTIDDSTIRESSVAGVQASGGTLDINRTSLTDNTTYGAYVLNCHAPDAPTLERAL